MSNAKTKFWAFTQIRRTEDDMVSVCNQLKDQVLYTVVGYETGPVAKLNHLQGYVVFINEKSYREVRKILGKGFYSEAYSSPTSNSMYCKKEMHYMEFGKIETATKEWHDFMPKGFSSQEKPTEEV